MLVAIQIRKAAMQKSEGIRYGCRLSKRAIAVAQEHKVNLRASHCGSNQIRFAILIEIAEGYRPESIRNQNRVDDGGCERASSLVQKDRDRIESKFETAMSSLPSPLKSAIAKDPACTPADEMLNGEA